MGRLSHWLGHNGFVRLHRTSCEIELFFMRSGFYTMEEGGILGFTWERFLGRPGGVARDGYRKFWGPRLSPRRIYNAIEFAWYMRGAKFLPCDGLKPYCLWSHSWLPGPTSPEP